MNAYNLAQRLGRGSLLLCLMLLFAACTPQSEPAAQQEPSATTEETAGPTAAPDATDAPSADLPTATPEPTLTPVSVEQVPAFVPATCADVSDTPISISMQEEGLVECGFLVVPEEHANPDGPTIQLDVIIFRQNDAAGDMAEIFEEIERGLDGPQDQPTAPPDSSPLVMAQGGPGGSTIETYAPVFALGLGSQILADRDVILFDQRGTLGSQPALACPEMLDYVTETIEQDLSLDDHIELQLAATQECYERLSAEGINLSAYNSVENAADVAALREALGYDEYNLYGVSYGSLLAQHVMRDHPEGLRSVILDAVAPTSINFVPDIAANTQRSLDLLFATCEADPACSASHPDLEEELFTLVEELNEEPVTMTVRDPVADQTYEAVLNGDVLLGMVRNLFYLSSEIPRIPQILDFVQEGNYHYLGVLRYQFEFLQMRSMSFGMYYSVVCSEDSDFTLEDQQIDGLHPLVARLFDAESSLEACELWQVEPLGPVVDEPVVSDIPTLLLSGELDPVTPPSYAEAVAASLSNSYSYTFPGKGHGQFVLDFCANGMIDDFLEDPTVPPASGCVETMDGLQLIVSDEGE